MSSVVSSVHDIFTCIFKYIGLRGVSEKNADPICVQGQIFVRNSHMYKI